MRAATDRIEPRPVFHLLQGGNDPTPVRGWFCGRCADQPELSDAAAAMTRVCRVCGLGLLLQAHTTDLPNPDDAFLIVDPSFAVQALSRRAETCLGMSEAAALNRHITELLIAADRTADGSANLAVALSMATRGVGPPHRVTVSRANTYGERLRARISACGPPPAALVLLAGI